MDLENSASSFAPTPPVVSPIVSNFGPQHVETGLKYHDFFSKKIWVLLILFLFLGAASVAGAYYAFTMQFRIDKNKVEEKGVAKQLSPTPTLSPTPDPNTKWKTYNGGGFSFQYPNGLTLTRKSASEIDGQLSVTGGSIPFGTLFSQTTHFIYPSKGTYFRNGLFYSSGSDQELVDSNKLFITSMGSDIKIGNHRGKIYYLTWGPESNDEYVYFTYNNTYYQMVFDIAGGGLTHLADQILSTFKFTDTSPTVTNVITCSPRPACLHATPRCMIMEPANGWCPTN